MRRIFGVSNSAAKTIRIENLITDGNLRGQTDKRIGTVVAEQMAHIKVMCLASDGNSIENVVMRNIRSIDPVADCILVGPSEPSTRLNGSAAIANVTLENLHAGARNSVRAFVSLGSGVGQALVKNVTCDQLVSKEGNSIETEFSSIGTQRVTISLQNCEVDDIEIGGKRNFDDQLQINLNNCIARRFALFVFCKVDAVDCNFGISIPNAWQVQNAVIRNTIFRHAIELGKDGRADLNSLYFHSTASGQHHVSMIGCKHYVDGALPKTVTNPFIRFGTDLLSNLGEKSALIQNAWFDPKAPQSILARRGWSVTTQGCIFGGRVSAVGAGNFKLSQRIYGGRWHSIDDDFRAVLGVPFAIRDSVNSYIVAEIEGGKWPTLNYDFSGIDCATAIRAKRRVLITAKYPINSGGVIGDQIWLESETGRNSGRGNRQSWKATSCAPGGSPKRRANFRIVARP